MKIGIDARFYAEPGGIGRYIRELLKELEKQDTGNIYIVFVNREGFEQYHPTNPHFTKILAPVKWYTLKEQIWMKRIIKKQKVDLMHFPHWNIPLLYRRPFIVTIHDLILLKFPSRHASTLGPLKYWLKNLAYRLVLSQAVNKSQKILTPSCFVKKDILENFRVPEKKIIVTPEGLTEFKAEAENRSILRKSSITGPFFLYVGVAYPHKNLEKLILAFQQFKKETKNNYQLVLAGKKNYFYKQLEDFIKKQNIADVILTGWVTDSELAVLYQNALAYVFPSLYEGFGLPPLEAMAHNLPVISSNASCLPEILGEAALYFNPRQTEEITEAIKRISQDQILRQNLILAGQKQTKLFSWQNCAQLTLRAYLK